MIGVALPGALAVLCLIGGAYVYGRADGRELAAATRMREERIAAIAGQSAASAAAAAIAQIQVRHTTIRQTLETRVRNEPVYTDPGCAVPDSGLRDLNAALTGADPARDRGGVPAADAAR